MMSQGGVRSFTQGPLPSNSCREYILELLDLVHLYSSMEQEVDNKEGLLLCNAVISTCDSMLRTYDPLRAKNPSELYPIDSPVFYFVYGSSLLSLLFKAISIYPIEIDKVATLAGNRPNKGKIILENIMSLRKYQSILIEHAVEITKKGYEWALSDRPTLVPSQGERESSDPEAFSLFELLGEVSSAREAFIEALLIESFVNREVLSLDKLCQIVNDIEPGLPKNEALDIVKSKAFYFISNAAFFIETESNHLLDECAEKCDSHVLPLAHNQFEPREPNWELIQNEDIEDGEYWDEEDEDEDEDGEDEGASKNENTETSELGRKNLDIHVDPEIAALKSVCLSSTGSALGLDCLYQSIEILAVLTEG